MVREGERKVKERGLAQLHSHKILRKAVGEGQAAKGRAKKASCTAAALFVARQ